MDPNKGTPKRSDDDKNRRGRRFEQGVYGLIAISWIWLGVDLFRGYFRGGPLPRPRKGPRPPIPGPHRGKPPKLIPFRLQTIEPAGYVRADRDIWGRRIRIRKINNDK